MMATLEYYVIYRIYMIKNIIDFDRTLMNIITITITITIHFISHIVYKHVTLGNWFGPNILFKLYHRFQIHCRIKNYIKTYTWHIHIILQNISEHHASLYNFYSTMLDCKFCSNILIHKAVKQHKL